MTNPDAPPMSRPADPPTRVALLALAAANDRLLATIDRMTAADFAAPSALPGWTRAHVLAHLALNSKGLAGALTKLGQPDALPIYASNARRDSDIEALAAAEPAVIADRVAVGCAVLSKHLGGGPLPEEALESVGAAGQAAGQVAAARAGRGATGSGRGAVWTGGDDGAPDAGSVTGVFARAAQEAGDAVTNWTAAGRIERVPGGPAIPAGQVPLMRWREVEIHHADLDLGYGPPDWSPEFADYLLGCAAFDRDREVNVTLQPAGRGQIVLGTGGPAVHGESAWLAWWLVGRGPGSQLVGDAPRLGPWVRR